MKKLKITMKEIRFGVIAISLTIFVFVYFVLYEGLVEQTNALNEEKAIVDQQIEERLDKLQGAKEMKEQIIYMEQEMREILDQYPSQMTLSDLLLLFSEFEKEKTLTFLSLSYGENNTFYDTTVPQIDVDSKANMTGIKASISVSYQGTYEEVKSWMQYLEEYPMRISLDSISMSYDDTTALVNGTMSISVYAIEGNGVPYNPASLDSVPIGKENIFQIEK